MSTSDRGASCREEARVRGDVWRTLAGARGEKMRVELSDLILTRNRLDLVVIKDGKERRQHEEMLPRCRGHPSGCRATATPTATIATKATAPLIRLPRLSTPNRRARINRTSGQVHLAEWIRAGSTCLSYERCSSGIFF
ncbi:hypothetical protein KM043_015228 [Ampulex compressa]|nr:hypothetical protein KM043_015228 [Ampulex compressa]